MERIPDDTSMVCIEDFFVPHRPAQMNSAKGLIMLGTTVRLAVLARGLPFFVVAPTQLKKYVSGKGNGPKGIVIREIYKKWGVDAKDDNQADACVLSHMAEGIHRQMTSGLSNPGKMHKYQLEMIDKVIDERPSYNLGDN